MSAQRGFMLLAQCMQNLLFRYAWMLSVGMVAQGPSCALLRAERMLTWWRLVRHCRGSVGVRRVCVECVSRVRVVVGVRRVCVDFADVPQLWRGSPLLSIVHDAARTA
jgi:hypothetical protein